jgi:chromosome segregation ATPase
MKHIEYVLIFYLIKILNFLLLKHIVDLIESLDNKRFETIQFTFKQVSLYFTEVFKRLVPEGTAHLVIKKGDNEVCLFE